MEAFIDRHTLLSHRDKGFTVVELLVVITVIIILTAVTLSADDDMIKRSRDSQRANDVSVIANDLEMYYRTNPVMSGATYPTVSQINDPATRSSIITSGSDVLYPPDQTIVGFRSATSVSSQTPSVHEYIYQPFDTAGALCTASPCVRYKLYYRKEMAPSITESIVVVNSMRQQ